MITKIFHKNKDGKIEFTESALKELLDEIYKEGFREGERRRTYKYTTPGWWNLNSPFYTYTTTTTPLTLKSNSDYSTISTGHMTNTNINDVPTATTTAASSNIVIKGEK